MPSMLRHLCTWRDERDGKPYDALSIIAHSQSTMVTADLLRFIRRSDVKDPELERLLTGDKKLKLPVYFFTMGASNGLASCGNIFI